jgi:hypothetical protein
VGVGVRVRVRFEFESDVKGQRPNMSSLTPQPCTSIVGQRHDSGQWTNGPGKGAEQEAIHERNKGEARNSPRHAKSVDGISTNSAKAYHLIHSIAAGHLTHHHLIMSSCTSTSLDKNDDRRLCVAVRGSLTPQPP